MPGRVDSAEGEPKARPRWSILHRPADEVVRLPVEGHLSSFDGATGWINSDPLSVDGLRGRMVLVQFWTYTCVNWLRTLPYVRAWDAKYGTAGLTVVGVHTPEFGFERDVANVVTEADALDVHYPIAMDNDYAVWRAFDNHYWPALYLTDRNGRIRYHHFGEGEYAMTEMAIQMLLVEEGAEDVDRDLVEVEPRGLEVAANWHDVWSPETYLGSLQTSGFASPDGRWFGESHDFAPPTRLDLNQWAPQGPWTVGEQAAFSNGPGARIAYRFHARDVNLVMGPASRGASIPFRVLLDGQPPGAAHGDDVDAEGNGGLERQRPYQLIRQVGPVDERLFEIEFDEAGAEAFCFTFG